MITTGAHKQPHLLIAMQHAMSIAGGLTYQCDGEAAIAPLGHFLHALDSVGLRLVVARKDEAINETPRLDTSPYPDDHQYQIGDLTEEKVFKAAGLKNMYDMQLVLDAVEKALDKARTDIDIPDEIRAIVLEVGEVRNGFSEDMEASEHARTLEHMVKTTSVIYGQTGKTSMQFLINDRDMSIAMVGTSPKSLAVAQALGSAWNWLLTCSRQASQK